jgi:hypothetical protein
MRGLTVRYTMRLTICCLILSCAALSCSSNHPAATTTAKAKPTDVNPNFVTPEKAAAYNAKQLPAIRAAKLSADLKAAKTDRSEFARSVEGQLLSKGLDAHVRATGKDADTLRIEWAAMSRPVVYNLVNSPRVRLEAPTLGFKQLVLTDGGGPLSASVETWSFRWNGETWAQ